MKLACLRCKRKKIKCDKRDPICHQCITAKATCEYVERRQRPRLAQQRVAVHQISQRLEQLEKQITTASTKDRSPPSITSTNQSGPENADVATASSPSVAFLTENAQDSWIYRMATDTRRKFQDQTTPINTPTPHIDDVMSSLNDALKDLGKLKIRTDLTASKTDFDLSTAELQQFIERFIEITSCMVPPDVLEKTLDVNLLRMLPEIINSPYVKVDPSAYVLFFNAIHWGSHQSRGPEDPTTRTAYVKMLEAVPAWLDASTDTKMDGLTASLSAWTAINNLDYQLSWKFHCKACQFIKVQGIDQLDVTPAQSFEEEDLREAMRFLYWQVLATECLFRLFYGKPAVLPWSPNKVKPPAVLSHRNMHPSASSVMMSVVWTRYTLLTIEMIQNLDKHNLQDCDDSFLKQVDEFCMKLEEIMVDWDMEAHMKNDLLPHPIRCLIADHIMNIYAVIIGVKRLAKSANSTTVHPITLHAARKVVNTLLYFQAVPALPKSAKLMFAHFISFYPFCAIFSLYEYILASTDPEECEEDICALESIGEAMAKACAERSDLIPFAKTVNALNKVSRTIQEERRNDRVNASSREMMPSTPTTQQQLQKINTNMTDFDYSVFGSFVDLPMNVDGDMDPLGFVRALESDFTGRNWHDNWWDMDSINSTMDNTVRDIPGS